MTENTPPGAANDIEAPYNSDEVPCIECDNGQDEFGNCWYCGGKGVVSEREYKERIKTEIEDFNANN